MGVALSGVALAPDWRPCLSSNLSDQPEFNKPFADFGEGCTFHLVGRSQAKVLALRSGAQRHKLRIAQFDAHDPTLFLILEARTIRAPHQDEPRIGQSRRGGCTRSSCEFDNDTSASFRTESQSI